MKNSLLIFFGIISISVCSNTINAQEKLAPPPEGKAVIYFLRTTNLGALMNFRFFEKGNFIGKFNGKNYMRYECDPGKSVFWVKAENIDFIETDLEAGKIYLVESNAVMGGFSAGVKFRLVDYDDEKQMKRIHKLLEEKEALVFNEEELESDRQEMPRTIQSGMRTVQKKRTKGKKIKRVNADMNYIQ